jgi:hypothetical protein
MEFECTGPMIEAKRREFARLVAACDGDLEMADDLVAALAEDPPTLEDLRRLVAHAREVQADIADERRKR